MYDPTIVVTHESLSGRRHKTIGVAEAEEGRDSLHIESSRQLYIHKVTSPHAMQGGQVLGDLRRPYGTSQT